MPKVLTALVTVDRVNCISVFLTLSRAIPPSLLGTKNLARKLTAVLVTHIKVSVLHIESHCCLHITTMYLFGFDKIKGHNKITKSFYINVNELAKKRIIHTLLIYAQNSTFDHFKLGTCACYDGLSLL